MTLSSIIRFSYIVDTKVVNYWNSDKMQKTIA